MCLNGYAPHERREPERPTPMVPTPNVDLSMKSIQDDPLLEMKKRARRRLVGAVVLVLFAVILLAWVLDRAPATADKPLKNSVQVTQEGGAAASGSNAPAALPKDSEAPRSSLPQATPLPVPAPVHTPALAPQASAPAVVPAPTPSTPAHANPAAAPKHAPVAESKPVLKPHPSPSEKAQPNPNQAGAPKPETEHKAKHDKNDTQHEAQAKAEGKAKHDSHETKASSHGSWVVQVGAYGSMDKAQALQKELASKGLQAHIEPITKDGHTLNRIRMGPYHDRQAAEAAKAELTLHGWSGSVGPK